MKQVAGYGLVGYDDDIVPLPNIDEEPVGLVWHDWNEVCRHDGEVVAIKTNFISVVRRCIYKPQHVSLAARDCVAVVRSTSVRIDVRPIDQNVVARWWGNDHTLCHESSYLESRAMEPVIQR